MARRAAAVFFVLLTSGGCVSAHATYLGPHENLAPVPEEQVRLYLPGDSLPPSCSRLAYISLAGDANTTNEAQMLSAARRRAGKIGANAVQLTSTREPRASTRAARVILGSAVNADRRGEALAFTCTEEHSLLERVGELFGMGE
jgi:hypothetical protein